jgi:hypothetical protein
MFWVGLGGVKRGGTEAKHFRYANRDRLKNAGASIKELPSLINEQMSQGRGRKEGRKKPLPKGSMSGWVGSVAWQWPPSMPRGK